MYYRYHRTIHGWEQRAPKSENKKLALFDREGRLILNFSPTKSEKQKIANFGTVNTYRTMMKQILY
jgi:hypothetical protein